MKQREKGSSEIIGAIVLTGIIAAAIGILGLQWLAQIPTASPPYINLEIGCGNGAISGDFSCRTGTISCDPDIPKNSGSCKKTCPAENNPQYQACIDQCESQPNCYEKSDQLTCNTLFICHNGGDSLDISQLTVRINGQILNPGYSVYDYQTNATTTRTSGLFKAGEIIRLPILTTPDSVVISYLDRHSGQDLVLINKKW